MVRASVNEIEKIERGYWGRKCREIVSDWRLYVMLVPLLFVLVCWKYLPIGSMVMSFKYYEAASNKQVYGSNWVGLFYFDYIMFGSEYLKFWKAFRNTFTLSFYGMVFGFPFPILLALLFSEIKSTWYRATVQIFCYLPKFVSTVVVTSITILLLRPSLENGGVITQQPGPITSLIQAITGQTGLDIMKDPKCFRAVYQVTGIWETAGYGSIVYFAAILGISPTNYEAARIDGASKMQQIRYVTIPGMTATLVIMLILDIGKLLTIGYEKVILLQGTNSDVLFETAETISTYVWHMNLGTGVNKAAGAAADMLNSVISMLLVIGSNQIARKVSSTSLY